MDGNSADLLSTSRLYELGWTAAAVKSLLGAADDFVQVKRGAWFFRKHLYERARVDSAMQRPEFLAIAQRRARKAEAPARRRAEFQRRFSDWRGALPEACFGMHNLNRFAKWRECTFEHRAEIYDLKNRLIELLYPEFCSACWIHLQKLPAKQCRSCMGSGDEGNCERCNGTGEYAPARVLRFFCFRFDVGRIFTWHQPDNLVKFAVRVTEAPKEWDGAIREKPLSMKRSDFARAKELIRWVLDQAKENPATEPVEFLPVTPITPVDAEQLNLFQKIT